MIGAGTGSGLTLRTLGDKSGEQTHALSIAELATHVHSYDHMTNTGSTFNLGSGVSGQLQTNNASSVGSGAGHNNMQPFGVANYIIKT